MKELKNADGTVIYQGESIVKELENGKKIQELNG